MLTYYTVLGCSSYIFVLNHELPEDSILTVYFPTTSPVNVHIDAQVIVLIWACKGN